MGIVRERVALRGEEVLQKVSFADTSIKKDPLLVTPIGICLNYYDQKNNFIFVPFPGDANSDNINDIYKPHASGNDKIMNYFHVIFAPPLFSVL